MKLDDLIHNKDVEGLKDFLRNCPEEDVGTAKELIKSSKLLTSHCIANLIRYRDPNERLKTGDTTRRVWAETDEARKSEICTKRGKAVAAADHSYQQSEEFRQLQSQRTKEGMAKHSDCMKGNTNGRGNKGRKLSDEQIAGMKLKMAGKPGPMEGKKHTEEAIRKMQEAAANRTHRTRGWLFKYKTNTGFLTLESSYELSAMQFLKSSGYEPTRCQYIVPRVDSGVYKPDLQYVDDTGLTHIVEVKPAKLVTDREVQIKFRSAQLYFNPLEYIVEFLTEEEFPEIPDFTDPCIVAYMKPGKMGEKINWTYIEEP